MVTFLFMAHFYVKNIPNNSIEHLSTIKKASNVDV